MQVKIHPITVSKGSPFAEDLLSREKQLGFLSDFVSRIPTPYALAIDSPWGTGKTKLLEMWRVQLEAMGIPAIFFNAWGADHSDEPLAPLLAAIRGRFPKEKKRLLARSAKVLVAIAKSSAPSMAKIATMGALDLESANIESTLSDAIEKIAEEQIASFARKKSEIEELAKLLTSIAENSESKRIVIMIDELDRCRPAFAISLLERVKHVVETEGLVFVFALDRSQLAHSVQAFYGAGFDGTGYLSRFFDQAISLPPAPVRTFATEVLEKRLGIHRIMGKKGTSEERDILIAFFGYCCSRLGLSLREVEQCAGRLALLVFTVPPTTYIQPIAKVVLSILAQTRPATYQRLVSAPQGTEIALQEIERLPESEGADDKYWNQLLTALILAVEPELFDRASTTRRQMTAELRELVGTSQHHSDEDGQRKEHLQSVLREAPGARHLGYGVKAAVEAISFSRTFLPQEPES